MNPYPYRVNCDVCGGPGVGNANANAAAWLANGFVSHNDPRVCQFYLEQRARNAAEEARQFPPINWRAR